MCTAIIVLGSYSFSGFLLSHPHIDLRIIFLLIWLPYKSLKLRMSCYSNYRRQWFIYSCAVLVQNKHKLHLFLATRSYLLHLKYKGTIHVFNNLLCAMLLPMWVVMSLRNILSHVALNNSWLFTIHLCLHSFIHSLKLIRYPGSRPGYDNELDLAAWPLIWRFWEV